MGIEFEIKRGRRMDPLLTMEPEHIEKEIQLHFDNAKAFEERAQTEREQAWELRQVLKDVRAAKEAEAKQGGEPE